MTKTLSKILAVVLSICMIFAVPVMAGAEETATFAVNGVIDSVNGNWENDYAESITIRIKGYVSTYAEDAVVTVGFGESNDNLFNYNLSDVGLALTPDGGDAYVTVPFGHYINHAETYNFYFAEGSFVSPDGKLSEELVISVSGNDIIEKLDVEHISVKPIEKLIDWMYTWGAEGFWLDVINFVVKILNWFLTI